MFLFLASPLDISLLVFFSRAWGARSLLQRKPPLWGTSLESAHGTLSFSGPSSPPSSFAPCLCLLPRISACATVPFPYHIPGMTAFCLSMPSSCLLTGACICCSRYLEDLSLSPSHLSFLTSIITCSEALPGPPHLSQSSTSTQVLSITFPWDLSWEYL